MCTAWCCCFVPATRSGREVAQRISRSINLESKFCTVADIVWSPKRNLNTPPLSEGRGEEEKGGGGSTVQEVGGLHSSSSFSLLGASRSLVQVLPPNTVALCYFVHLQCATLFHQGSAFLCTLCPHIEPTFHVLQLSFWGWEGRKEMFALSTHFP
jgi:hypothetical protein